MPCLDEASTVAICVDKALAWLKSRGMAGEVIVVDNGCTDGSPFLAARAGARVVAEAERGYGAALRRGFETATGDVLIMGDCDDTYDFSNLDALVAPLADGCDLVVGDRFAGGIAENAMPWSHRYVGTPALSFLVRLFSGIRVGDSQCGLRAFTREAMEKMELTTSGMELASEMLIKASRQDLRIASVPVPYNERIGIAKLNTVRDGWRHVRFLMVSTPNYLFTLPGLLLTILGLATLLASLPAGAIEIGATSWQPVFAGGALLVVGVNALFLGFASRIYTTERGLTKEDAALRFYRRYLGLETLIVVGLLLGVLGAGLDVGLALGETFGANKTALAGLAQALIAVGANIILVGFISSLPGRR
jgi:glycosyltransferase involved in cell wall biosynthesis